MLKQINNKIAYSKDMKRYIHSLMPLKGGEWDNKEPQMQKLHTVIREQLKIYQDNECAYCGLHLEETGKSEIEHIAPKGGKKRPHYPQFAFTRYNLALACNLCNSPIKKGTKDTFDYVDPINYRQCTFKMVHPYFDNPEDHFEYSPSGKKIIVQPKTPKGIKSIEIFDLNNEAHCNARAKEILLKSLPEDTIEDIITNALLYKPLFNNVLQRVSNP